MGSVEQSALQIADVVRHPDVMGPLQILGIDPGLSLCWCKPLGGQGSSPVVLPLHEVDRDSGTLSTASSSLDYPEGFEIHRLYKLIDSYRVFRNGERVGGQFGSVERAEAFVDRSIRDLGRTKVGFWKSEIGSEVLRHRYEHLPDPSEFVDEQWSGTEREAVLATLASPDFPDLDVRQFRGLSALRRGPSCKAASDLHRLFDSLLTLSNRLGR